jgi:hypothetical protein
VTDPHLVPHPPTPAKPVPKLAPPPGVKIPSPRPATQPPPSDPRAIAVERATTAGPRVQGPSQLPRAPLPPKTKV